MKSVGMEFRSTADSPGIPETKRRPLTRTRVREVPRLRRSTVATPTLAVWKAELVRLIAGLPMVGLFSSTCCRLVAPDAAMSAADRTCSGDGESAFGERMREPVTSMRCMAGACASVAAAACCWAAPLWFWPACVCISCAYAALTPTAIPPRQIRRIDRDKIVSIMFLLLLSDIGCPHRVRALLLLFRSCTHWYGACCNKTMESLMDDAVNCVKSITCRCCEVA